jgi:hypothetical protein
LRTTNEYINENTLFGLPPLLPPGVLSGRRSELIIRANPYYQYLAAIYSILQYYIFMNSGLHCGSQYFFKFIYDGR